MLPWIMLGASLLQQQQKKKDMKKQAMEQLMMQRAQDLGANTSPLQAMQTARQIKNTPMVDPGLLASAIGSTVKSQSVDDRLADELAHRGLMKGAQPFDPESNDPSSDMASAVRSRDQMFPKIGDDDEDPYSGGGFGGYYGGGR